jgi:hypothetical protein
LQNGHYREEKHFEIKSLMRFKCRLATYGAFWEARLQVGNRSKTALAGQAEAENFSGRLVAANQLEGIQSQKKPASGSLPVTG